MAWINIFILRNIYMYMYTYIFTNILLKNAYKRNYFIGLEIFLAFFFTDLINDCSSVLEFSFISLAGIS